MGEIFEPSPEQFGVFWNFLMQPDVTDVDFNGSALWITDLKKGKYRAKEAEEHITLQIVWMRSSTMQIKF